MSSSTSLTFAIPSTNSFGTGQNLMTFSGSGLYTMGGTVTLATQSVIPATVPLVRSNVAAANWVGLFGSVTSTTSANCIVLTTTPVYSTNTVDITLTPRSSTGAGCPTVPAQGLSGGAIAGIVIGCIVGAALLVILAIFLFRKIDFDSKRQLFSRTKIHAAESSVPM